jgi:hypothetical protein
VHGTKLPFLKKHREDYLAAAEIKGTGTFYEKVAHLYLRRYGYHTPWDGDLDSDQDVASNVNADEDVDDLNPEEAATCVTHFKLLKGVSMRELKTLEMELMCSPENRDVV